MRKHQEETITAQVTKLEKIYILHEHASTIKKDFKLQISIFLNAEIIYPSFL